jgi:phage baseplate assembly protein W
MQFTIKLNDALFEAPVREAISQRINSVVREAVNGYINQYQDTIDKAVENYLESKVNKSKIEELIDIAVKEAIAERMSNF